jgi:hypothetical protein
MRRARSSSRLSICGLHTRSSAGGWPLRSRPDRVTRQSCRPRELLGRLASDDVLAPQHSPLVHRRQSRRVFVIASTTRVNSTWWIPTNRPTGQFAPRRTGRLSRDGQSVRTICGSVHGSPVVRHTLGPADVVDAALAHRSCGTSDSRARCEVRRARRGAGWVASEPAPTEFWVVFTTRAT